eukprot:2774088-Pleurochrysis_carterae.AAC.1
MTVAPEAKELPVLVSLCCIHRDKESGRVAQLVHERCEGCGNRQEWNAIVARESRLPAQQLLTREVRWANEGRWVRIAAQ